MSNVNPQPDDSRSPKKTDRDDKLVETTETAEVIRDRVVPDSAVSTEDERSPKKTDRDILLEAETDVAEDEVVR